jgi:hypothetical protein
LNLLARQFEPDIAEVFHIQPKVHAGAFRTPVAQEVPDRFQRGALPKQMYGE